jgi:uncharacterized protein DUF1579
MAENRTASSGIKSGEKPDPALKRLDRLAGTWELKGRTLDSNEDNITGRVVIEWLMGGLFLQQRGEMTFQGTTFQALEILRYDPATDTFPSIVYSSMSALPAAYQWDVQGDVVTHWTEGSKYTGTFSADDNTLTGGWRPDTGVEESAGNTYDAVMIRVK